MLIGVVKLIRQLFFMFDSIIYNGITEIYRLLIDISRTSVLSQSSIESVADRIYQLLAVFMTFKVIFSLIMYVVNPDDFSDKSKGLSKLGLNIMITLALLVLTPYAFRYAYQIQNIILEDNSLGTLIFGDVKSDGSDKGFSVFSNAGEMIAFNTMKPFFVPNTTMSALTNCVSLTGSDNKTFNKKCSGIDFEADDLLIDSGDKNSLGGLGKNGEDKNFTEIDVANYVYGYEQGNLGLFFRSEMALATAKDEQKGTDFVIDYKFLFSTPIGIVVVLLLISFCMDVALRSIKLAFLQLIAPIPILSYIDPKSGKDGMFKKWYQMCFKTFASLFVRLLALYFAIFIISKVDRMSDVLDGSYQSNAWVIIFVIIGCLMFAKQFTKILEGLGIKLDGDGKFTLNPLKKFEEEAFGGKNITGGARGLAMGMAGTLTGAGAGRIFSGAFRGLTSGKGWKETGKAEREMNQKMRIARANGSTMHGRLATRAAGALGLPTVAESMDMKEKEIDNKIKKHQDAIDAQKYIRDRKKAERNIPGRKRRAETITKSFGDVKNAAIDSLRSGQPYLDAKNGLERAKIDKNFASEEQIKQWQNYMDSVDSGNAWVDYVDQVANGGVTDDKVKGKLNVAYADYKTITGRSKADIENEGLGSIGKGIKAINGQNAQELSDVGAEEREIDEAYAHAVKSDEEAINELNTEKSDLIKNGRRTAAQADADAVK